MMGRGSHLGMEELSCKKRPGRPAGGQAQARRHVPSLGAQVKGRKAKEAECRMTGGPLRTAFWVCSSAHLPGQAPARAASCTPQSKAVGITHPTPRVLKFSSSHGCKTAAGPGGEAGVKVRDCGVKGCLQEERDCPDWSVHRSTLYTVRPFDGFVRLFIGKACDLGFTMIVC